MNSVTALLVQWQAGDQAALERLIPLVYEELRRLARARAARETGGRAMPATALVHEVYLRLVDGSAVPANSREHFMAIASRLMRQILVDDARRRQALKRAADLPDLDAASLQLAEAPLSIDTMALDQALDALAAIDPRQKDVVEMKFFGGLTIAEIGAALGVSHATVEREWAMAKAFLFHKLHP